MKIDFREFGEYNGVGWLSVFFGEGIEGGGW